MNFAAPVWLITLLFSTGDLLRKKWWLIPVIFVIPFTVSIPMLFPESSCVFKLFLKEIRMDEQGRVLFENFGFFRDVIAVYAAVCIFFMSLCLLNFFRKNKSIKLIEKIVILPVFWSPIVAWLLGLLFEAPFEITPLTLSLVGTATAYLALQRQFLNVVPSLIWNIFDITKESMAVLNADGLVNVNKSFTDTFGNHGSDFWCFADELYSGLTGLIRQKRNVDRLEANKNNVFYEISIKNIFGRRNKIVGQLITISDVSEAKQLTLVEERARIASGLHDNMGNSLIASINNLNVALMQPMQEKIRSIIDSAVTSNVASLMTLRKIVEGLSPVNFSETELVSQIKSIINRISASGVCTDLQVFGDIEKLSIPLKEFVYNTCQEVLTNSIIHGKAENITIKLEYIDCILSLDIVDNGRGCEKISKNNGLTSMENRAKKLGGKIRFESTSSCGFCVFVEIPFEGTDLL
jgi:signal transduction histidine kinase